MEQCAGIIIYRKKKGQAEVMLSHAGGPYFAREKKSWGIQKGLIECRETEEQAARREFEEETGFCIKEPLHYLGNFKSSQKKRIAVFSAMKDIDASKTFSNYFEMEYPKNSGKIMKFPENDRAKWFTIEKAREIIFPGQVKILEALKKNYNL